MAATTTTAATPAVEVCGQGAALVKPGSVILTCAAEVQVVLGLPVAYSTVRFQLYPGAGTTDIDSASIG